MALMATLKCLFTENKPKKELIQVLIQRGYESDPVKAWKELQNKVILEPSIHCQFIGRSTGCFAIWRTQELGCLMGKARQKTFILSSRGTEQSGDTHPAVANPTASLPRAF